MLRCKKKKFGGIMKSIDLAKIFLENSDKKMVISDVFDFLGYNCTIRGGVDFEKLDNLIRAFENGDGNDEELLVDIINIIKSSNVKNADNIVNDVKRFIDENFNEDISVEEIAQRLNFSYYYLCHLFKDKTGETISLYRNLKRIEKAVKKLVGGADKISDIATFCGFNNLGYFSEAFSKTVGCSPTEFREKNKNKVFLPFYNLKDCLLASKMENIEILGSKVVRVDPAFDRVSITLPTEEFAFLHESAIIEFKGVLYASWYNCVKKELVGYTPICGKRSYDGGKTWTDTEVIAEDKSGKILYCPPVYGICDGRLYLMLNQMVAPDHIHSLDTYVLDENIGKFVLLKTESIPFKLNTNVVKLSNGKLLLPGRMGELDGFPTTPAVLISDTGKIDGAWRMVKVAQNGILEDGEKLVHPETTVIECCGKLYMFNRNDRRRVPLVYISEDFGESWSRAFAHDVPYVSSKIYGGTLQDGRNYLIANIEKYNRSCLAVYFSDKNSIKMTKSVVLFDVNNEVGNATACHYPSAVEFDGKLYIIATLNRLINGETQRGAEMFIVDLKTV